MYRSLEQFIVNTPKCIYGFGSTYKAHLFLSSHPVRYVHVISTPWRDFQPELFEIILAGDLSRKWKTLIDLALMNPDRETPTVGVIRAVLAIVNIGADP